MSVNYPGMKDKKDVYNCFHNSNDVNNKQIFIVNNWNKNELNQNHNLAYLHHKKGAIWLNSKGDLCYRLAYNSKVLTACASKVSIVFTNFLDREIDIRIKPKLLNRNQVKHLKVNPIGYDLVPSQILINELLLVNDEHFAPSIPFEFYKDGNGLFYRNTFKPSFYLQLQENEEPQYLSIILQYIFHLSDYKEDRFKYIMNWIAAYFKNLNNKSDIALVLLGKKKSGKNIFFDEIIRPLFGEEYSVKVNDAKLHDNSLASVLENQIFYNFDDIASTTAESKETKAVLNDVFNTDEDSELLKFGQTLITISEPYIPYIDNNYKKCTVFKVPTSIDDIYLPQDYLPKDTDIAKFTEDDLINTIKADLTNFSFLLKSYKIDITQANNPFEDDDRDSLIKNLKDKIKAFSKAVREPDEDYFIVVEKLDPSLYEEIMADFGNKIIKQRNLIKCFTILHKEEKTLHSRTLMVKLRAISGINGFFDTDALETGTGGVKYFNII